MQFPFNCQHGHSCRGVFVRYGGSSGALFDPSAPGTKEICQPPSADYTEERYASGAVLLHLERRTEAIRRRGYRPPFDPEPSGKRLRMSGRSKGGLSTGAIGADELSG